MFSVLGSSSLNASLTASSNLSMSSSIFLCMGDCMLLKNPSKKCWDLDRTIWKLLKENKRNHHFGIPAATLGYLVLFVPLHYLVEWILFWGPIFWPLLFDGCNNLSMSIFLVIFCLTLSTTFVIRVPSLSLYFFSLLTLGMWMEKFIFFHQMCIYQLHCILALSLLLWTLL